MSLVTGLFSLVLLWNQRSSPPLRLQDSQCSTFHIMWDVSSTTVFCSESIECFPGTVSKFFLKLLFTIPVAPIITGTIVHFRFYIRCLSIQKLLYFNFFSASFCTAFLSAGNATSISVHVFSFFVFKYYIGLFTLTSLSVCTAWFHNILASPFIHWLGHVYYYYYYYYYYYLLLWTLIRSTNIIFYILKFLRDIRSRKRERFLTNIVRICIGFDHLRTELWKQTCGLHVKLTIIGYRGE
jgi:hypothetical protein